VTPGSRLNEDLRIRCLITRRAENPIATPCFANEIQQPSKRCLDLLQKLLDVIEGESPREEGLPDADQRLQAAVRWLERASRRCSLPLAANLSTVEGLPPTSKFRVLRTNDTTLR
jgi:hypothetical protein